MIYDAPETLDEILVSVGMASAELSQQYLRLLLVRIQIIIYVQAFSEWQAVVHATDEREFHHLPCSGGAMRGEAGWRAKAKMKYSIQRVSRKASCAEYVRGRRVAMLSASWCA